MDLLQEILFYIQVGLGVFVALLSALMIYVNFTARAWKAFWYSLASFLFIVMMLAKPIIYILGL
jgi:hypothetical protein